MIAIWKFVLPPVDVVDVPMPQGAKILSVQAQGGIPCVWAQVETTNVMEMRRFYVFMTGEEIDTEHKEYLGTILLRGGSYVIHIYLGV